MEISPADAVPYLDRVPHGVVELIEGFGAEVVSSGTLITGSGAGWARGAEGHRRAAERRRDRADHAPLGCSELGRGAEVPRQDAGAGDGGVRARGLSDHPPSSGFRRTPRIRTTTPSPKRSALRPVTCCCSIYGRAWPGAFCGSDVDGFVDGSRVLRFAKCGRQSRRGCGRRAAPGSLEEEKR